MKRSHAFTVIELIFVIVVLGILASVALPKFSGIREQADIAKGKGDVATIRAAIVNERQTQLIKGVTSYIPKLSPTDTSTTLFEGDGTRKLLAYGIKAGTSSGSWEIVNANRYKYHVGDSTPTQFDYNATSGSFGCTANTAKCNELVD